MAPTRRWAVIAAAVAALALVAGVIVVLTREGSTGRDVTGGTTTATTATTTTTTERGTTLTAPARTAAVDLARFLAAVQQADRSLKSAATAVNAGITGNELRVDQATADAVRATGRAVTASAAAIPAGLEPDLLRAVLLVQSDLASRSSAMNPAWSVGTHPLSEVTPCLHNGSVAAARYPADLATLRSLAATSAPVAVAAPDSRAAEELAVRVGEIDLRNNGCDSCGGYVATDLSKVTFYAAPTVAPESGSRWDGVIGDVPFRGDFTAGAGWKVEFNAC